MSGRPLISSVLMYQTIHACAPGKRLVRLTAHPVTGAIALAREVAQRTVY